MTSLMKNCWNEIQEHRAASGLFLVYWAVSYLLHISRWHAPSTTGDMVPPVLLLHALLPALAGFLAAWWHGPRRGRIARGLLAGTVVTLADSILVFAHDAFAFGESGSGEGILELPAFLIVLSVFGAALGSAGALGGAALGGKIPAADNVSGAPLARRKLVAASAAAFGAALLVVTLVIPPVGADTSPQATPGRAVPAFGIIAVLNVYAGVAFRIARSPRLGRAGQPLAIGAALLTIATGAVLAAAGAAASGRTGMVIAGAACLLCALGDFAAGALALTATPRRTGTEAEHPIPGRPGVGYERR